MLRSPFKRSPGSRTSAATQHKVSNDNTTNSATKRGLTSTASSTIQVSRPTNRTYITLRDILCEGTTPPEYARNRSQRFLASIHLPRPQIGPARGQHTSLRVTHVSHFAGVLLRPMLRLTAPGRQHTSVRNRVCRAIQHLRSIENTNSTSLILSTALLANVPIFLESER